MNEKTRELRQKRANLIAQARELVERAEEEKREMSADENQQYDRIMKDIDDMMKKIEREEKLSALEEGLQDSVNEGRNNTTTKQDDVKDELKDLTNGNVRESKLYRRAFFNALRNRGDINKLSANEIMALDKGSSSTGSYIVPVEYERTLIQALEDENIMRRYATVITTSAEQKIPVASSHGTAEWIEEKGDFTESEETFSQISIDAYKVGTLIKVSNELLQDSMFDLESYIKAEFTRRIGAKEEEAFIDGDGDKKPTGFVTSAGVGVTAEAADALTGDNFIDLYYGLRRPYRSRAIFMMSDGAAKAARKLKDANGQYLWQPGLIAGQPDTLLGRPAVVSDYMDNLAAGKKPVAFGDFSYYWIANRLGIVFQPLKELYATAGMTGFLAYMRVDGKLTLAEAIKVLQMKS